MGAGAKVMDGVIIGADAIVGAGAVLTVNVPERGVAMGRPARLVGSRDEL
jgi:acetyltransferase-like isoleucine patch superfamily enzyme